MKPINASVAISLLFASLGAATACTKANAKTWQTGGGVAGCNGDAGCIALVLGGQCNAQVLADSGNSRCVRKRATTNLECSSSEVCFLYIDGDLLCLNQATGEYHDDKGGKGNYKSGVYTYADGEVLTNTGTAAGTRTGTAIRTGTTTTTKTSGVTTTTGATARVTSTTAAVGNSVVNTQSATTAALPATTSRTGAGHVVYTIDDTLFSMVSMVVACAFWW